MSCEVRCRAVGSQVWRPTTGAEVSLDSSVTCRSAEGARQRSATRGERRKESGRTHLSEARTPPKKTLSIFVPFGSWASAAFAA